jgi:hypothetical protein
MEMYLLYVFKYLSRKKIKNTYSNILRIILEWLETNSLVKIIQINVLQFVLLEI